MRRFVRPIPITITAVTLVLLYTLAGFFFVPYVIKAHVLPALSERLDRPVTTNEVAFNPFILSLRMTDFEIQERDHTPLLGFQEFFINFQTMSVLHGAYVFDEIRFSLPFVSVKVAKDGHVNLAGLLSQKQGAGSYPEAPGSPQDAPTARSSSVKSKATSILPAVEIRRFEIARGMIDFYDASKTNAVSIDVVPINLVLNNFHTRPGGDNSYSFTAELGKDEVLDWKGTVSLEPVASEGTLSLSGVRIATIFQYVRDMFHFDIPTGTIRAMGRYRFTAGSPFDFEISSALLHLTDVEIVEKNNPTPVIALQALSLDGIHADLGERRVEIDSLAVNKGTERIWRNQDGALNVSAMFLPVDPGVKETASPADRGPAWTVLIKDAKISNHNIEYEDRSLALPARLRIGNFSAGTHDVVFPFTTPIPLAMEAQFNESGTIALNGQVVMKPLQADLHLALKDIPIQPFEPYVEPFARIAIDSGAVDLDGTVQFAADHPKGPLMTFEGSLGVKGLAIADRDEGHPVAAWKQLQVSGIALDVQPTRLAIEEVGINQPTVHLAIDRDGLSNLKKLSSPGSASRAPAAEGAAASRKSSPSPSMTIKSVKVLKGTATFEDNSISPAVQTGLYDLTGTVKGLSSKQLARAEVNLSGKIDKVAPLKVAGTINPLTEDAFTDLTIKFDNVDLTTATPYSGKYVGYSIRKGKLFLDLAYKVSEKQLEAENKVAIDQLTFGEKTNSPDATSLPVPFAVALLKNREGRIDIDLPIRGDLKDPDFKYGKAVWSTLGNLLTKMVASPFSLIGKLVPGGDDADGLQRLTFEPGSTAISPADLQKIDRLTKGLEERPALRLEITGTADPTRDRTAVAQQRFQEILQARWREQNGGKADKSVTPEAEASLIAQLFEQWRSEHPQSVPLPAAKAPTIEEMKRKLVESIRVDDDALRALARTRAEQVHDRMVGDGKLPEERVFLTDVEVTASDGDKVPSRLNITAGS